MAQVERIDWNSAMKIVHTAADCSVRERIYRKLQTGMAEVDSLVVELRGIFDLLELRIPSLGIERILRLYRVFLEWQANQRMR